MRKCPNCGTENADNALQCSNCRANLRTSNGSPVPGPFQTQAPPPNPAMMPLRNHNGVGTFFKVVSWILFAIFMLAGISNFSNSSLLGMILLIGGPIGTLPLFFFGTVIEDLHDIKNILLSKK